MEKWKEYILDDFIEFNPAISLKKGTVATKITMDKIIPNCRQVLANEKAPYDGGMKFQNHDTIMARITPCLENGKCAYISELKDGEVAFGSTEYFVLRAREGVSDPLFVYYLAISPEIKNVTIQSMTGTSGRQRAQIDVVKNYVKKLPCLELQRRIAAILSSLDDKIEVNRRINDNLEQQAQALFRSWFVDFEPFGGDDTTVEEYLTPKRGKNLLTKDAAGGDVPVVAGGLEPSCYHNVANTKAPVITISASGANAGFVNLWNCPVWSADSSYIDNSITPYVYFWYNLLKYRQKEIFDSQTGSAQPHIYPQHISAIHIPALNMEKVARFNDCVKSLYLTIGEKQTENLRLSETRDTLLPKLMSGEISVK